MLEILSKIKENVQKEISENNYGFKGTNYNMKCRDFQYRFGKEYQMNENDDISCCNSGFHYCRKLDDVNAYYSFLSFCNNGKDNSNRFFLVKPDGIIDHNNDKSACSKITFIRELTVMEMLLLLDIQKALNLVYFINNNNSTFNVLVGESIECDIDNLSKNLTKYYIPKDIIKYLILLSDNIEALAFIVKKNINNEIGVTALDRIKQVLDEHDDYCLLIEENSGSTKDLILEKVLKISHKEFSKLLLKEIDKNKNMYKIITTIDYVNTIRFNSKNIKDNKKIFNSLKDRYENNSNIFCNDMKETVKSTSVGVKKHADHLVSFINTYSSEKWIMDNFLSLLYTNDNNLINMLFLIINRSSLNEDIRFEFYKEIFRIINVDKLIDDSFIKDMYYESIKCDMYYKNVKYTGLLYFTNHFNCKLDMNNLNKENLKNIIKAGYENENNLVVSYINKIFNINNNNDRIRLIEVLFECGDHNNDIFEDVNKLIIENNYDKETLIAFMKLTKKYWLFDSKESLDLINEILLKFLNLYPEDVIENILKYLSYNLRPDIQYILENRINFIIENNSKNYTEIRKLIVLSDRVSHVNKDLNYKKIIEYVFEKDIEFIKNVITPKLADSRHMRNITPIIANSYDEYINKFNKLITSLLNKDYEYVNFNYSYIIKNNVKYIMNNVIKYYNRKNNSTEKDKIFNVILNMYIRFETKYKKQSILKIMLFIRDEITKYNEKDQKTLRKILNNLIPSILNPLRLVIKNKNNSYDPKNMEVVSEAINNSLSVLYIKEDTLLNNIYNISNLFINISQIYDISQAYPELKDEMSYPIIESKQIDNILEIIKNKIISGKIKLTEVSECIYKLYNIIVDHIRINDNKASDDLNFIINYIYENDKTKTKKHINIVKDL